MYIKRNIDAALVEWREDAGHKPLLLRGARQTGKTTAVRHLAESFAHYVEINFERDVKIREAFAGDLKIDAIVAEIELQFGTPVIPGKTLLFFDEIQECPRAISALRFFYEEWQSLHVIAAGSLLEFVFEDLSDFGVGRIRNLFVYPLSFSEFVGALGGELALSYARRATFDKPLSAIAHQRMLDYLKAFLIVGGMPGAVLRYVETKSYVAAQAEQDDILISLKADFGKYKTRLAPDVVRNALSSVVRQTGGKFVYSDSLLSLSYAQSKNAVELLERAKLVVRVDCTHANGIPLGADLKTKDVKFFLFDTGLYLRESGLDVANWATDPAVKFVNRGKLAEMFAGLELKKAGTPFHDNRLFYWRRDARESNAEVDYVVQFDSHIVPVEIKSGKSGAMKSLHLLMVEKGFHLAVRASEENFGSLGDIRILPLYFLGEAFDFLKPFSETSRQSEFERKGLNQ